MAGRGRGRGKGYSFPVESLGFGRGEALPTPTLQPPSNYPVLDFKPVSLLTSDEYNYILALKQEFRGSMQESAYFLRFDNNRKHIERYSDKYQLNGYNAGDSWEPDWSQFPAELKPAKKRKGKPIVKPNLVKKKTVDLNLLESLQELEKKEQQSDGEQEEEEEEQKGSGDEEVIDEELYDEEEMEEETDYVSSYFDNGEGYGVDDEDDGLDDGPTY